ncbi:MAG: SMR family transporter [Thermomicrobiaceae bacterium]
MTALATLLVLGSALMHATWNMLAKRSSHPLAFLWLVNTASMLIFLPVFLWALLQHGIPARAWPFVVATGLLHIFYVGFLSQAYRYGALSIAYPISRGTGVALVPLIAIPLLGEETSMTGLFGIALVLIGIFGLHVREIAGVLGLGSPDTTVQSRLAENRGAIYALITGLSIAAYSLVDKAAMDHAHPLVYGYLIFVSMTIGLTPYVLANHHTDAAHELRANPGLVFIGGLFVQGTYLIVLAAMTIAPVSYIVPLREVSVLFGAVLGMFFLKESMTPQRVGAAAIITTGVILIAVFG